MSVGILLLPHAPQVSAVDANSHCTVVYGGEYGTHAQSHYMELSKLTRFLARSFIPFAALVTGEDIFGTLEERTYVLRLESPFLYAMRNWVDRFSESEYLTYKPHLSVDHLPAVKPEAITFDRIALWLGHMEDPNSERYVYRLGTGTPCSS